MLCMMHIVVYRDTFETIMENALIDMEEAEENYSNDTLACDVEENDSNATLASNDEAHKVIIYTQSLFLKIIITNFTMKPFFACFGRCT